jgi:hypothetical protein
MGGSGSRLGLGSSWRRRCRSCLCRTRRSDRGFLFRSPHVTQRSLAAANVRLTAVRNGSRDITNCRVRIVMGRPCNGIASAAVTTDKPCKGGNCLVTNLSIGIGAQNLDEVGYNVGDANIVMAAPLTGEAM